MNLPTDKEDLVAVPDFNALTRLSEQAIGARLELVRAAITHKGEKGATLERTAARVVRDMLHRAACQDSHLPYSTISIAGRPRARQLQ